MKQILYDQITAQLSLERSSLERVYSLYPHIDKSVLLAIYLRRAQNLYKVAHANLSALPHPPDYFYTQFRLEAQRRAAEASVDGISSIIAEMGAQVGLPPCLMARFVIKSFLHLNPETLIQSANDSFSNDPDTSMTLLTEEPSNNSNNNNNLSDIKTAANRVSKILKTPELINQYDQMLAAALRYCLDNDFLTSPAMDVYRHKIGQEKEAQLLETLKSLNILFQPESEMRAAGYPKTPDALLAYPVEINGHIVNWIESKALFGDTSAHAMYARDQYWPYYNRFGPGLVIYWFGFIDELNTGERGILILDHLPLQINKIKLESL